MGFPIRPSSIARFPRGRCQRLLPIDALAGRDGPERHVGVRGGNGQVKDEVDVVGGQQFVHRHRPDAVVVLCHRLGAGGVQVRHGHESDLLQLAEVGKILGDDCTATDDSYP